MIELITFTTVEKNAVLISYKKMNLLGLIEYEKKKFSQGKVLRHRGNEKAALLLASNKYLP